MSRLPAALFVVDIKAEHIAKEAQKLNIPVLQWLILTLILVK
jgi:small subunit ribosomal protein S2